MADETTTDATVDTGVTEEVTQPVEAEPAEAVETTEVATEEQTEDAPESAAVVNDEDAELADWASKKGLELDSDNAKKAAKMAREAEKLAGRNGQRAGELEKAVTTESDEQAEQLATATGQDPEFLKRLQRVEVKESVRDFWNQDGIDRSMEPAMIEVLAEKPYLAGDLDSLYAVAIHKSGNVAHVKSQGGREALTKLAHTQQAAVPAGNATSQGTPKTKPFEELSIAEMEKKLGFTRQ